MLLNVNHVLPNMWDGPPEGLGIGSGSSCVMSGITNPQIKPDTSMAIMVGGDIGLVSVQIIERVKVPARSVICSGCCVGGKCFAFLIYVPISCSVYTLNGMFLIIKSDSSTSLLPPPVKSLYLFIDFLLCGTHTCDYLVINNLGS